MKYLKLFEKFESLKLSKTLSFLKDKSVFISELKFISNIKDIPLSNFTDDMFQYMPFKKALKFLKKPDPEACQTCSGEGKYRRPWGKGTRLVKCLDCDSTGKVFPTSSTISHIKFWFNSEGQYLGKTCTTGEVYVRSSIKDKEGKEYTKDATLTCRELSNNQNILKTGDKVYLDLNYRMTIATVFKQDDYLYFIQDHYHYGQPTGSNSDWKKYGSRSCGLSYLSSSKLITTLRLKEEGYSDPKDYNFLVTSRFVPNKEESISKIIDNADFSLILDMSKIPNTGGLKSLKDKREGQKNGILGKDDEIRKINIRRYLSKLSQSFKISDDLLSISRIPSRIFGRNRSVFFIYSGEFLSLYSSIITNYYTALKYLKLGDEHNFTYYENIIKSQLDKGYNKILVKNEYLNNNIIEVKKAIEGSGVVNSSERKELVNEFISLIENLGVIINSKILSQNLETIFDMEVSYQKISSLMNIMTSDRYKTSSSSVSYFMQYITQDYPAVSLLHEINYLTTDSLNILIDDVKKITQIVNRM
jgi:hypothetical protein